MPYGISRLTALVVPLALFMPLSAALGQERASQAARSGREIVQIDQQFIIRTAERRAPVTATARTTVRLGSSIHVDRGLLAPTPLSPAKSTRANLSQANVSEGGINETR